MRTWWTDAARTLGAAFAVALLAGCAANADVVEISEPAANGPGPQTMDLAGIAERCAATADSSGAGLVDVPGDLRDANVTVTIETPCLVRLASDSDVTLNNVTLNAAELEIDDIDANAGRNRIRLQNTTVAAQGIIVTLSDPDDSLSVVSSDLTGARGIAVEVAGTRDDDNTGGDIRFVDTQLAAPAEEGAGVAIAASEHDGRFRSVNLTVDSPADVIVTAGDCRVQRSAQGEPLDCSTDRLVAELRRQADEFDESEG